MKFLGNPSRGSRADACVQMGGRTDSLIPFQSNRALLWRFIIADNTETYSGLCVMCSIFVPNFNQIWVFKSFHKCTHQFSRKSIQLESLWYVQTDRQTDRQRDLAIVIGACRDYTNTPSNSSILLHVLKFRTMFVHKM